MSEGSRCPPPDALQQLTQGQLPESEAASVERHLVECAACAQTVETLRSPTNPVPALGAAAERTNPLDMAAVVGSGAAATVPMGSFEFLAPPQQADELGRLGSYRVLKVLGEGGMGMVFLAEDTALERKVALKVMKPDSGVGVQARQRFLQEGKVAAALQHDHIVTIYQVGEDRGVPFLAMQFLQGESLDERLKRERRLSVPEVLRVGREVAEGLGAAHERGLIHRDIKPANIWLERVDAARPARVKILDFGLARAVGDKATHLTRTGVVMGTPDYMAPEQARGLELDYRCDLFSLGCVLYHLCTGQKPFHGEDVMATLLALTMEEPTPIRQLNPEVPWELEDRIKALMAKVPGDRPKTARAVVDELTHVERALAAGATAPVEAPRERERNYVPASRRKLRKESPPPRPPVEEPTRTRDPVPEPPQPNPTPAALAKFGLQSWGEGTTQAAPVPSDMLVPPVSQTAPLPPAVKTPPAAPILPALKAPAPAVDKPHVCPRCGSNRFSSLGAGWCLACGYIPGTPLVEPDKKSAGGGDFGWVLALLGGAALVILVTLFCHVRFIRSTQGWNFWVLTQMGAGLALLLFAHIWAYIVVWPYHDSSRSFTPLWCSPIRFWTLVLRMHFRVHRPLCLATWGLTAALAILYVVGDPLFFVKGSKMKMPVVYQLALKRIEDKAVPKDLKISQRCVVIGYLLEDGTIGGVVLAESQGSTLKYVGVAERVHDSAANEEIGLRLSRLNRKDPVIAGLKIAAKWVEPKITCQVDAAERDINGILIDPMIVAWEP